MDYRHELKFLVSDADLALLRARICHIAMPDRHQPSESGYLITSLYFDNNQDQCAMETISGYDYRNKYRIRIYGHSDKLIKLERKSKTHGMTAKKSVPLSRDECVAMMQGQIPKLSNDYSTEKNKILCEMKLSGMRPKCIVQYQRQAFVYDVGNVRITFDQNITASKDVDAFLNERLNMVPLLKTGVHILEVKYDNLLPKYISDALEIEKLLQTSFSKYVYARNTIG